jgi:bifunctional DNA-binding transcriptional regulator/antitoxin component of YhaV-PrlF toxin-antitoxin module
VTAGIGVREALEVTAGDRLAYEIHPGYAIIRPYEDASDEDPALGPFLASLAADIRGAEEGIGPRREAICPTGGGRAD